jgi:DNA-binding transcriptional MerR regulator
MNRLTGTALTAGRLGAMVGVSADTIRYYEKRGVLPVPARTPAGYRCYPKDAVLRVRMIRGALAAGFTLEELAEILKERDSGGTPCRKVVQLANAKLRALDGRIVQLNMLRNSLASLVDGWTRKLTDTPAGTRAYLLAQLSETGNSHTRTGKEIFDENQCLHIAPRRNATQFNTGSGEFARTTPTER